MGSGNSRLGSHAPRPRSDHRAKLKFSTFLCGGASTSASTPQIQGEQLVKLELPDDNLQNKVKVSALISSESSSTTENLQSSLIINNTLQGNSTLLQNDDIRDSRKSSSESKDPVPCISSESSSINITHSKRTCNIASTSSNIGDLESTENHAAILSSNTNLLVEEPLLQASSIRNENVLHVDVVSVSSNILPSVTGDVNGNDARRNSRRQFWDAFSRRNNTRRNYDYLGMEDYDDMGSHDRWLLDVGDDLFGSRFDHDSVYLHRRSRVSYGRRWHSRSEIRERLRGGSENESRQTTFCPSGLHPDGACSCDSFLTNEQLSTQSSISRIVLLAEALFEVLDEIHRQPNSLSLSMASLPAPESIVNSLPVKSHIKHNAAGTVDEIEQCYICLAEYEESDEIRVLPCRHEYHMSCVDKWLKEIHGICPLCRGDVREVPGEGTSEFQVSDL